MQDLSVAELAKKVGLSETHLLERLAEMGITLKDSSEQIDAKQSEKILSTLGEKATKKITLKRRSVSTINVTRAGGQRSTVSVVKKKRRTYVKRPPEPETPPSEIATPVAASIEPVVSDTSPAAQNEQPASGMATSAETDKTPPADPSSTTTDSKSKKAPVPSGEAAQKKTDSTSKSKRKSKSELKTKEPADKRKKAKMKSFGAVDEISSLRARRKKGKQKAGDADAVVAAKHGFEKPVAPKVHTISIPDMIKLSDLAQLMSVKASEVIKVLMKMGTLVTINQMIDQDTAILVVEEMGHTAVPLEKEAPEESLAITYDEADAMPRAPVVTVMGHVDHGKTSLLDAIRRTKVTADEKGGITQHIGAYCVKTPKGDMTFLDTPGHAAFTAMRARGAKCTDIVILVVAADDGVMPQTIEAIAHAKAAGVPIVVAVNKMDKPDADFERIQTEVAGQDLLPEEWGGEVLFKKVSAHTGDGIDALLEAVLLQAELLELKASPKGAAQGVVVEARLEKGRGVVASLLVQTGELKTGDIVLAGQCFGRVRAMHGDCGQALDTAGPSIPVEILGLSSVPLAGDAFQTVDSERQARTVAEHRHREERTLKLHRQQASNLEKFMGKMEGEQGIEQKVLNLVLKADVQGSVEALKESLLELSNEEVKVVIVSAGVGGINESDISLAMASSAVVIGFNVRADAQARKLAEKEGMNLNYHSVIYEVIDAIQSAVTGMVSPKFKEVIVGTALVRSVFRASKFGAVAGCIVEEGNIKRGNPIRVLRNHVVIYEGELESLRRFKDDVDIVKQGTECGIAVKNYNDVKEGDRIEVFEKVQIS